MSSMPPENAPGQLPAPVFDTRPVPHTLLADILALAQRAPSGVNTQPWHVAVVQGATLAKLRLVAGGQLRQLLSDRDAQARFWQMFQTLPGRSRWAGPQWGQVGPDFVAAAHAAWGTGRRADAHTLARQFDLYGAPVALLCSIDNSLGLGSVLDCGMFLQNIVSAAPVHGLRAEVLSGWRGIAGQLMPLVQEPQDRTLLAAVAIGFVEPQPGQGTTAPPTVPAGRFTTWHG